MGWISDQWDKLKTGAENWAKKWASKETGGVSDLLFSTDDTSSDPKQQSGAAPAADTAQKQNKPEDPDDAMDGPIGQFIRAIAEAIKGFLTMLGAALGIDGLFGGTGGGGSLFGNIWDTLTGKGADEKASAGPSLTQKIGNWASDTYSNAVHGATNWVSKNWAAPAAIASTIIGAAVSHGADPGAMLAIAKLESNDNPNADNGIARGLFQFVHKTAQAMHLVNPFDPVDASRAASELWVKTKTYLSDKLGRTVTNAEVYLGHMFGQGGAEHLLASSNMKAVDALKQAGYSNPESAMGGNLTAADKKSNPDWRNMSAGQLSSLIGNRYNAAEAHVVNDPQNKMALNAVSKPGGSSPPQQELASNQPAPKPAAQPQGHTPAPDYRKALAMAGIPDAPKPTGGKPKKNEHPDAHSTPALDA